MLIKNIRKFRTSIKNKKKDTRNNKYVNEHFVGAYDNKDNKGFFGMYHGIKEEPAKYLASTAVKVAADEQAIYEFIQNAVDCKSTHFYMFYNEKYFLAINNGKPFTGSDVEALLNFGQSNKGNVEIGSFGVGFKLTHRLVGVDDGVEELIKEYKGPVIFSWSKPQDINDFLIKSFSIAEDKTNSKDNQSIAWLFKICLTTFPTHPDERVKNLECIDDILFTNDELDEFIEYFTYNIDVNKINIKTLSQGSMFFLKLGEGKKKYIDKNRADLEKGIAYSLNTFSNLSMVCINEKAIGRKPLKMIKDIVIPFQSEDYYVINPKKERDINIYFGYYPNFKDGEDFINSPNFYNFFPMVSEIHEFRFMVHSNAFDNQVSRQELQKDNPINRYLLSKIKDNLVKKFKEIKNIDTKDFRNIYANLLLSNVSKKEWINEVFFDGLIEFLKENIPTNKGYQTCPELVVIKKTSLSIDPADWGVEGDWFYWTDFEEYEAIIKEAQNKEKLCLEEMSISSLIESGDIRAINEWILNSNEQDFTLFLNEIENDIPEENFFDLEFLRCTDNNYYSINQISSYIDVLCLFEKIYGIKDILHELGLTTTVLNISDFKNISELASEKILYLKTINEKRVFEDFIKSATKENILNPDSKKRLFIAMEDLNGVGDKSLKEWELFFNTEKDICSLNKIISSTIKVEKWLVKYQLLKSEFFEELEEYLLQVDDIYPSIIFPLWEEFIELDQFDELSVGDFYYSIKNYFNEEAHKHLELNEKAYIFTAECFYPISDVFYNEVFNSTMDYQNLKSSIEKVTGLKTPSKEVLKYLTESPFKTDDDKLLDRLSDCSLEQLEAYELLRYCHQADVKLFSKGVFSEYGNDIYWECNDSKIQYFSEDPRLIEFINEYLEGTFYLLPSALQDFKSFEGIRRNQELYEEIIEQLETINDLAIEFLPLLKHKEVIKSYISNLPDIRIENKSSFDKSSFEYIVISNIITQFEDEELEEIKEKIIICDDYTEFKLEEIVTGNEVRFDIDDKIYNIKVSEILPDSDNFAKAEQLETIMANFKRLELPKTKIDKLLSIEIEEDDLAEKLADELLESLENNTLETAEQIAFCLLYELQSGWSKFDDFQIYASNNQTYKLNEVWYAKPFSFLSETGAIGEQYKGLSKLLKIKDENPIFKVSDSCIFLYKPAFDEDGIFVCNYIDENLDERKCTDLFNYLFEEYNKRGKESRRDFEEIDDWSKLGNTETEIILGFNPNNIIFVDDDEILLSDEVAPDWIQEWAEDEANISFLKVLGIHSGDSEIVNLRKSLYDEEVYITKDEITGSSSLNAFFLENTLKWLVESEIWEDKVIVEPLKVELLDAIIDKLGWNLEEYWSVDIETLNENSEEWDDEGYSNWREENDSFGIRMYHDQMPYILQYENNTLAEKNQDDYWYDDENEILYVNCNKSSVELQIQKAADEELFEIDIKPLINKGLAKVNELERKVRELEEEIIDLKSTPDKSPKKTTQVSEEDRVSANFEARIAVKNYLLEKGNEGYDVSEWDPELGHASVCGKIKKNGEYIDIVVKSAKWGDIFLAANEFELLCQDAKNQLFVYNSYDVKPVTLNSVFEANSLIQLQIDTNHINSKFLGMLAKAFQYVTNTKFVVEDPNHSAHNLLRTLGMNNLNEGFISASFDDEF